MRGKINLHRLPELPDLHLEQILWKRGIKNIAGIDEAGRGALAGPVCAATVILPSKIRLTRALHGVRDSKQLTPSSREAWAVRIREVALTWGVGFASAEEIDNLGIVPATRIAATRALEGLSQPPDYLLIDYITLPEISLPQTALVKGDCLSLSIATASILAKTARDALMRELEDQHPGYGFARHKGYGTLQHRQALQRIGTCVLHRKSFSWHS